jgi:uroporphyrinogen-III decarboxylase
LIKGDRTIQFIRNVSVDRFPFHPLVMRLAASKAGIPFSEYCTDYRKQVEAMLFMVDKYGIECVHPSGWPYCEAIAYGLHVTFPIDNLPVAREHLLIDPERTMEFIRPLNIEDYSILMNRVECVSEYRRQGRENVFICGHHEGMFAEYADLRGLGSACMDLFDHPSMVREAFLIMMENAKKWGRLQVEAGAECMSIGDAVCSQIGPELYDEFIFTIHRELTDYYHSLGVLVKIHICGDISNILPSLIKSGADIIDVDHMVMDISQFVPLLGGKQVFCGNLDPVSILQNGTPDTVYHKAREWIIDTGGKGIISGGCELTPDTPDENIFALYDACRKPS